jgi:hypothetical protein
MKPIIFTVVFLLNSILAIAQDVKGNEYIDVRRNSEERKNQIIKEISALRREVNPENSVIMRLQNELDAISNMTVTMEAVPYSGRFYPAYEVVNSGDYIGNIKIFSTDSISCLATATETTQQTAGRIWAIIGYGGAGTSPHPDSIRILYSDNDGAAWNLFTKGVFGGTDKFIQGISKIDMEIIEGPTGNKYLYAVYTLRTNNGTGNVFTGGFVIKITGTFESSMWVFTWPGYSSNKRYYNIRMTSDIGLYPNNPYLYVVCSFDSSSSSGRVHTQKFARITNTYSVSPAISYRNDPVYYLHSAPYYTNIYQIYSDIAFFSHNSGDSVIISDNYNNPQPSSFSLSFVKMGIYTLETGAHYDNIGGSEPADSKMGARLSSNGNSNGSIICVFQQKTNNIWNMKFFRTNNWGNFNNISFQSSLYSGSVGTSEVDIMGIRNGVTHKIAFFKLEETYDYLNYYTLNNNGILLIESSQMNPNNTIASCCFGPAAGYRNSGESCFALYTDYAGMNAWAAYGCFGAPIGIKKNEQPAKYNLSQNYPNPFNPVTNISFEIPEKQFVTLKIFDLLGNEVGTLVNEEKFQGKYSIDFNASVLPNGVYFYRIKAGNFTCVKKMVLLK